MTWQRDHAKQQIRAKITDLASELGRNATTLTDDDIIPRSGLLDSAAILGLIVWCESEFQVTIDFEEISVDNFGSIHRMLDFLEQKQKQTP